MSQFKPYPVYKDSGVEWLGEVPEHWSAHHLKRTITKIESGTSVNAADYPAELGALGVLKTSCVYTGQFDWKENKTVDDNDLEKVSCPLVLNTLVVSRMNTPELVGATGLVTEAPQNIYLPDRLWQVYFEKTQSPLFIFYFTKSFEYRTQVKTVCSGTSSSMQNLGQDDFRAILLAVPSLHEQTQIARFLDYETARIDALIEEQKHLIELLKEKRQAVISHTVTKGLDPTVPMKDSGVEWLGEVPAHWKISPLKYHCTFSGGGTPSKENLDYWNGDIPWVSPKDMKRFWIPASQAKITMLGVSESSTSLVSSGAVLMVVRSGILQRTIPLGINSVEVSINQDMKALRFSVEELARYFTYLVIGFEPSWLLAWRKQGATVESLEQEYLSDSLIPIPSKNEANAIVEKLNWLSGQYDDLERESRESIRLLQERRSALISAAVTGKIDVRDWQPPTDNSAPSAAAQKTCLEAV